MHSSNQGMVHYTKITSFLQRYRLFVSGFQVTDNILAFVRIIQTYLTHSYLHKGEEAPKCAFCNPPPTAKHILEDCLEFASTRDRFFHAYAMSVLFDTVKLELIFLIIERAYKSLYKDIILGFIDHQCL